MLIMITRFSIQGRFVFQNKGGLVIDVDYSWDFQTNETRPGILPHSQASWKSAWTLCNLTNRIDPGQVLRAKMD